jgi:hypothetical protein
MSAHFESSDSFSWLNIINHFIWSIIKFHAKICSKLKRKWGAGFVTGTIESLIILKEISRPWNYFLFRREGNWWSLNKETFKSDVFLNLLILNLRGIVSLV